MLKTTPAGLQARRRHPRVSFWHGVHPQRTSLRGRVPWNLFPPIADAPSFAMPPALVNLFPDKSQFLGMTRIVSADRILVIWGMWAADHTRRGGVPLVPLVDGWFLSKHLLFSDLAYRQAWPVP
jgi:hypothetical protein